MWRVRRFFLYSLVLPLLVCDSGHTVESGQAVAVTGTVTDTSGNPLEGVKISAKSGAMGRMLWWAFEPSTSAGTDGRFELQVPFEDVAYRISAEKAGYLPGETQLIPDRENGIRIQLEPDPKPSSIMGNLLGPGGRGVAGAEVSLVCGYGGGRVSAITNEYGDFTWSPLLRHVGQAVPLVNWEGLVSPICYVSEREGYVSLKLVPPARVTGVCREAETGAPVAGATVVIRPCFLSDFRLETASNEDGTFEFDEVQPGECRVTAVSSTHFVKPPRGYDSELPRRLLRSGETTTVTLEMQPTATLAGRVLSPDGEPVSGALVCTRSTWFGDDRDRNVYVETDREGRFSITTGHLDTSIGLEAFSSRHGFARTEVENLTAGEVRDNTEITLSGSTRISGIVTDPQGKPLEDILVYEEYTGWVSTITGPSGKFDLGRIAFYPEDPNPGPVSFSAPRVKNSVYQTYPLQSRALTVSSRESAPRFFLHRRVKIAPEPGDAIHLDVVLEPTDLLELAGTVLDASDDPVPSAQVHLFTGDASAETWLGTVHPPSILTNDGDWGCPPPPTRLDSTQTDEAGRFRFWTVRENGEANRMGHRTTDWSSYCIGAESLAGEGKLVRGIVVPTGRKEIEVTITLDRKEPAQ